ncbi:hypothetical protein PMAYCL1PPCAC_32192, partial [Pristionchus mayeri]
FKITIVISLVFCLATSSSHLNAEDQSSKSKGPLLESNRVPPCWRSPFFLKEGLIFKDGSEMIVPREFDMGMCSPGCEPTEWMTRMVLVLEKKPRSRLTLRRYRAIIVDCKPIEN